MYTKEKKILPVFVSKINSNFKKQIIILIISNQEKKEWHYLAVKKVSTLLRGITSKYHSDFYFLICLHSFRSENNIKFHEKICKNKEFCGYSMSTIWGFDHIENKNILYHGKDCMKKFCTSLRQHAKNIIDFEKKRKVTVHKRRIKTKSRCRSMAYFQKNIFKKVC